MAFNLWTEHANQTDLAACTQPLREECAYIAAHPNIVPGSIEVFETGEHEIVRLLIRYGENNTPEESRLVNPEPVALIYARVKAGQEAPLICSERKDFPRDVPHLNPVKNNLPCSICLDRDGMQALYDTQGILGIITKLACWLEDTEAGCSQHDGWEPTPRGEGVYVSLNIGEMQRFVSRRTKVAGVAYGKCGFLYDNHSKNLFDLIYLVPQGEIKNLTPNNKRFSLATECRCQFDEMLFIADVPVVCIWASDNNVIHRHQPTLIDSPDSLRSYANEMGVDASLAYFENKILHNTKINGKTQPYILLLLAQRRPKPLIPDMPSDAVGNDRSIELIPLAIRVSLESGVTIESVRQCHLIAETTNSLLAQMSGINEGLKSSVVVGCGAVGSSIASQLGRLGTNNITLIDNDIFLPHNVSRHLLGSDAIGYKKTHKLKEELERQLPVSISAKNKKLQDLRDSELKEITRHNLLIDCTAELSMTQFTYDSDLPKVLKAELAYEGRLGILALEGETHNPCIQDIKACLYKCALTNSHIEQWLASAQQLGSFYIGQNCSSSTMIMPNYVVTLHTSSFMPKIQQAITNDHALSGLGINVLNEEYYPIGWEWLEVPAFSLYTSGSSTGNWDIRIHPDVTIEVEKLSSEYSPAEAGGFLYGTYDRVNRSICIVHQISPKTARHGVASITLPAAGETDEEKEWLKKTTGLLPLLGTWHSHVNQSGEPSNKDRQRMAEAATANVPTPAPFLVLIVGSDGLNVTVVLPENW